MILMNENSIKTDEILFQLEEVLAFLVILANLEGSIDSKHISLISLNYQEKLEELIKIIKM